MDQMAIIRRAWDILKRHKVLWIFGILVALTGGGSGNPSNVFNYSLNNRDLDRPPFNNMPWLTDAFQPARITFLIVAFCCLVLLLVIVMVYLQYVSRAALIRSVDQIEETGTSPTWREGFRLGRGNRTFRLFLLELIVGLITGLGALLLFALAASPLLFLLTDTDAGRGIGIALTVLLALVVIVFLIFVAIVLSVLQEFWSREVLLADRSIGEAISHGTALVRGRFKDVGVFWLLMLAIGIGFGILMIPVVLFVVALTAGVGGGLGYLVYQATNSVGWAVALGLPVALVILLVPLSLVGGLYTVFTSSAWTLAYRQVARRLLPAPPTDMAPPPDVVLPPVALSSEPEPASEPEAPSPSDEPKPDKPEL